MAAKSIVGKILERTDQKGNLDERKGKTESPWRSKAGGDEKRTRWIKWIGEGGIPIPGTLEKDALLEGTIKEILMSHSRRNYFDST